MSTIKFKRSSVGGKIPLVGDLDYGEMALNYADGILYYKDSGNAISSFTKLNTSSFVVNDFAANAISITNTTESTGTTTGALQVRGGVGIAGGVFVGGAVTATNISIGIWPVSTSSFNTGTLVAQSVNAQFSNFITSNFTATTQVGYATNILGGQAGQIPYQTASGATGFLSTTTLTVAAAITATGSVNVLGGTTGAIPYQTAPNNTNFIAIGPTGYVLTSDGTTATWQVSSGGTTSLGSIITTTQGWNMA